MKNCLLVLTLLLLVVATSGQTKPIQKHQPTQSDIDKMMEDATKGMNEEDKAAMKKMMGNVMPEMPKKSASAVASFTDNRKLIPAKDISRINGIQKKIFTGADVNTNTALLYGKLMAKIPASEKAIITGVMGKTQNGAVLMETAITSFIQGHNPAAIGLALKAVQAEPDNVNHQNNLAAILSQSGYPEKAIPYLKKLLNQFPSNSTVLHNLAYAWLSLGETDTACRLFAYAAVRNPNNPETKLCNGVIEELKGDPQKAIDNYVESFEDAPNPFTEKIAKNIHAEGRLEKIDFDKLKSRIVIYEYFKKDWIQIPELTDNVTAFEKNSRIKNGYSKMFTELNANIEAMSEASSAELEALVDKGVTELVETMMKESAKGLSMMSRPAVYVQKILQAYIKKWSEDYRKGSSELMEKMNAEKTTMTKIGDNDKCPDFDRKNNEFLAYANPLIRKFYSKKIEEFRVWLNAFCTWSWYIAGNPKNAEITQCIAWTGFITRMYQEAIENQYTIAMSCVNQNSDGVTYINVPAIPNFTCPAVVTIPVGLDELRLSADAINFDNNDWGIKQAAGATVPNVTLAIGVDKNDITEPGKYGNPYVKTGDGSINASGISYAESGDEELTPLSKIMDDLAPLAELPPELAPLNPALLDADKKLTVKDYKKIHNAELARKLLKEMMKTKCPGELPAKKSRKTKFEVGLGELELDPVFEVGLGEMELWDSEMQAWVNTKGEYRYEGILQLPPVSLDNIETSGLQTVINNGLEAAGQVKDFIKGLFE